MELSCYSLRGAYGEVGEVLRWIGGMGGMEGNGTGQKVI